MNKFLEKSFEKDKKIINLKHKWKVKQKETEYKIRQNNKCKKKSEKPEKREDKKIKFIK